MKYKMKIPKSCLAEVPRAKIKQNAEETIFKIIIAVSFPDVKIWIQINASRSGLKRNLYQDTEGKMKKLPKTKSWNRKKRACLQWNDC